jgi:hypothetical protein
LSGSACACDIRLFPVDEIGETCNLTTQDGTEVLYLDRVETK